jgi:tetratricopeptide (TPR) repeat protein
LENERGDGDGEAVLLQAMGGVKSREKKYLEAVKLYDRAVSHYLSTNEHREASLALRARGRAQLNAGDTVKAKKAFEDARAEARLANSRRSEIRALIELGKLADAQNETVEARNIRIQIEQIAAKDEDDDLLRLLD